MAEGENYQLLLNRQANIFSVVAKDGRGELMRVNVTTGKILYATSITGSDLERWQARQCYRRAATTTAATKSG